MKLPLAFSLKTLFRLLLPGFIASVGLHPITVLVLDGLGIEASPELILTASTVLVGWLFILADMPIYMALEGRRFWPSFLWELGKSRQARRLERLIERKNAGRETNRRQYLEASVEIRQYPISLDSEEYRAEFPTRLGNLLAAYEGYPRRVYGMDSVFYWPRLWVSLEKDVREEIDNQQAVADSAVYVTAALGLCGLLSLLFGFVGLLNADGASTLVENVGQPWVMFPLGAAALMAASLLYRVSLYEHAKFGEIFKAIFDKYRGEISVDGLLSELADLGLHPEDLTSSEKYTVAWRYLHNYRVKVGDKVLRPTEARSRLKPEPQSAAASSNTRATASSASSTTPGSATAGVTAD